MDPEQFPGYTGWPRKAGQPASVADSCLVLLATPAFAGQTANFRVTCSRRWNTSVDSRSTGTPLFYVRVLSRCIIGGPFADAYLDDAYVFSFVPPRPGSYNVEVVVEFSRANLQAALNPLDPVQYHYGVFLL